MTAPPVWKRGFAWLSAVLVVVMVAGSARAEVVFRKKAPPAEGGEASPSGGDGSEAAPAAEGAEAASPGPSASQAEDKDFPEAQAQRDKARADAALQRQMKNAELAKQKEQGEPFYQKWQFWTIAGGVVVGSVLLFIGGSALLHQANGGDVRACNTMMFGMNCVGEGRSR
ncbi:MAG TPA: hypothetical protein VHL80_20090 [Polyangia bacterium]|nr:hypothetical protein [Polyangia bacterium]